MNNLRGGGSTSLDQAVQEKCQKRWVRGNFLAIQQFVPYLCFYPFMVSLLWVHIWFLLLLVILVGQTWLISLPPLLMGLIGINCGYSLLYKALTQDH